MTYSPMVDEFCVGRQPCECGCGEAAYVSRNRPPRFALGHSRRIYQTDEERWAAKVRKGQRYRERHREQLRQGTRDWLAANPEKKAAYRAAHKAEAAAAMKIWAQAHKEERRLYGRARRASNPRAREVQQIYSATHRKELSEKQREWMARHPGYSTKATQMRRLHGRAWTPVDPWPNYCQVCGLAIDPAFKWPERLAETNGHEPPIAWVRRHPEYDGPLLVRPEHAVCNLTKQTRPDWELR